MSKNISNSWKARLAMTQPILLQPITLASGYHTHSSDIWHIATITFIIIAGLLINYTFINDVKEIIKSKEPTSELIKEYIWIFAVGCLNIMIFATIYFIFGISHGDKVETGSWYNSFYFSIVTWTTLGYGDFAPVENLRLVAAFEAMLGYVYMAVLVGLLLNITQHSQKE